MRTTRRPHWFRLLPLAACFIGADVRADETITPPTPVAPATDPVALEPETDMRSLPVWVWLVPPAGLVLGLGLGSRLRRSANTRRDAGR